MELCSVGELSLDESPADNKEGIKWPLKETVLHSWVGVLVPKVIVLKSGRKTSLARYDYIKRLKYICFLTQVDKTILINTIKFGGSFKKNS